MERIDLTVTHNKHFRVKNKNRVTSHGLRVIINSKWNIPQIFEIVLESYYLAIIKRISNPFPCCTNCKMFFHGVIILSKQISTVIELPNNTI